MAFRGRERVVAVTGDPTIDWGVMLPDTPFPTVEERLVSVATVHWHWGGSLGLTNLMRIVAENFRGIDVSGPELTQPIQQHPSGDSEEVHHSYNTLKFFPLPRGEGSATEEESGRRVRVEQFIGFPAQENLEPLRRNSDKDNEKLALLIIDDAGLGFGNNHLLRQQTMDLARNRGNPWILVKLGTAALEGKSALWQEQFANPWEFDDRVIPIVTAASLRSIGASISRGLSWERSAQDVLVALEGARGNRNPYLSLLARHNRMVVSFGPAGALVVDRQAGQSHILYFHQELTEGTWENRNCGRMFGYTQVLIACLARSLLFHDGWNNPADMKKALLTGTHVGLAAMQTLYDVGFEAESGEGFDKPEVCRTPGAMRFRKICLNPKEKLLKEFRKAPVPDPEIGREVPTWSILSSSSSPDGLVSKAINVALKGSSQLENVPVAKFGKLVTADSHEIEGLRIIQNLIAEYIDDSSKRKPRSIAVFGKPGDGKSFAVREMVKSLYPKRKGGLTFNLSQLGSIKELAAALHQVRDRSLTGEAPLVFWDEFDSDFDGPLGWLPYFLSPMQDGTFQQGELVHPIGRAIFVFAGGTSHRYDDFVKENKVTSQTKAKDFASRLQGYLDVVGPNRDSHEDEAGLVFHRALLLNQFLKDAEIRCDRDGRFEVDPGVVRAFLEADEYLHGARSMHTIVDISRLHKGGVFRSASLPYKALLKLHVGDAEGFINRARG